MRHEPVVVIGSGPCGAIAAARLVQRGLDVVMLDAGTAAPRGVIVRVAGNTVLRQMGWAHYESDRLSSTSDPAVDWYSSRSLGGLSNFWTAAVPRFAPEDFADGGRLDERYVWPITYDDLVPHYELVERLMRVTTGDPIPGVPPNVRTHEYRLPTDWAAVAQVANEAGHAVGAMPMAKGEPWMVARRGTEFNSYHCVVVPMLRVRNFRLVSGAHVQRLEWSRGGQRVTAVHYADRRTGSQATIPARAVVLAAGAIDSTCIVLRSTSVEFPGGLGNSSGLVGRYLHDHPRRWWRATLSRPMRALSHPVYVARAPYGESAALLATSLTIGLPSRRERVRTFYRGRTAHIGVQVFGTMVPTDEVGVTLGGAADTTGSSHPTVRLRYDSRAVETIDAAPDRLRSILGSAGIDVDVPGPFDDLRPGSSVHFGGTMRMHADPAFGVVDRWNRMHEVSNVVVCDSSCFTTGAEKNPTLTAMAIASRAADHLAAHLLADDERQNDE